VVPPMMARGGSYEAIEPRDFEERKEAINGML